MTSFPSGRLALAVVAVALPLVAGCQSAPRSRAAAATTAACRAEVDRVYAAQNRADLSRRDQRDTPFADSYNSGITSRGLGALFGRDNQVSSCISSSGASGGASSAVDVGTGPTFSPTVR
jgi:hypothetical protein